MLRTLQAFAWMRWRVLVNSLERTGARDTLERFSIAIEQIAPIIALVLFIPSALAAAGLGAAAGYALGQGNARTLLFEVVRYVLVAALALSIAGPIAMPAAERTSAVRLLLLPISRRTLYIAQTTGAIADPWLLLTVPLVLLLPAGLAAGGAFRASAIALVAAVLLLAVFVGISSLATSLLHLIVRDRRRGELLALVFILVLPMIGLLPALFDADRQNRSGQTDRRQREVPAWIQTVQRVTPYVPTELYVTAVRRAATGAPSNAIGPVAALAGAAGILHAVGLVLYGRLLDSPGASGSSRRGARRQWSLALPMVSPGTSAVALAHLRLAARTPRGRSMLLSPLILFLMFAVLMYRGGGGMRFGFIVLQSGAGLAAFGAFGAMLSILPVAMNQFAVDRAGLTLALLSPLSDRELLFGKALGNALIMAGPVMLCMAGALIAFPGGSPWPWLCIPLSLVATYVLSAPVAAALSTLFPRAVDMNSIGRGSNAHGAAGFLGFLTYLAAGAPCAFLVLLATRLLNRPALAPLFLLAWLAICLATSAALFILVRKLFARRRENLGMIV